MEWFHFIEDWFAPLVIHVLEFIGIVLIAVGSLRAFWALIKSNFDFGDRTTKIVLGECLALSLEFKLGAEIIKSVIIRDMQELIILAFVVVIRIVLTYVIHWELKQMDQDQMHQTLEQEKSDAQNANL
ncbi:hypothetical protein CL176_03070 [Suicoccus acidiformans]|uniref:DUF1622 domain-containing protein n=1 Tax=Suicoccus acidiformans TaxID=2036206 RepID=A0A347WJ34_9LACT|nr:DUF1622 domain-containing protein [Suicoccus acidiformans]AXY25091.1 hypothetical protein CL176_03070 [Suicoccus acidiformans]